MNSSELNLALFMEGSEELLWILGSDLARPSNAARIYVEDNMKKKTEMSTMLQVSWLFTIQNKNKNSLKMIQFFIIESLFFLYYLNLYYLIFYYLREIWTLPYLALLIFVFFSRLIFFIF